MTVSELNSDELNAYYNRYIQKLSPETELLSRFKKGKTIVVDFFRNIPVEKHNFQYESNKWSIKEIFQHLIDTERVFIYRCLRIARRDTTSLTGFDQDIYIEPSGAKNKTMEALIKEYEICRDHSISLISSLTDEDLSFIGTSNGSPMSARVAAFTIIGHDIWHMNVIKEKYLNE